MSSRTKSKRKEKPVPLFEDFNHRAKKIFDEEYNYDKLRVELKTRTPAGFEFSSGGVSHLDSGRFLGSLETKYAFKNYGVHFSEKWNTDNVLTTEVQLTPRSFIKGAKLVAESTMVPHTNRKSLRVRAEYHKPIMSANVDFETSTPRIILAGVIQRCGWFIGSQLKYDVKNSKLKNYNIGIGYSTDDFIINTNVIDGGKMFNGLIYQKINNSLKTGIEYGWTTENNKTKFGLGCKYSLNRNCTIRAKVNHSSQIGLGYSQRLVDGITVTLSTLINCRNFHQGGHKVGMGITFET